MPGSGIARRSVRALLAATVVAVLAVAATPADAVQPPPVITSFTPTGGVVGDTVTISGTDLEGATALKIGAVSATIGTNTTTSLQTTIPAGATTGVIWLQTPGGKTVTTRALTVLAVSGMSPLSGPFGTTVTLTGSGFNVSSTVSANGVTATIVKRTTTELQFTWPQAAAGGQVSVTTTAGAEVGTATSTGSFTVTPHVAPTVTSFTPLSDVTGAPVTITGTGFSGASSVKFGNRAASFTIGSDTSISATVPNGAAKGALSVTTAAGTGTSATTFTPTLSIRQISPASSPPGLLVTITGVGFRSTSTVTFNGTPASVQSHSTTRLIVLVPDAAAGGPVTVTNTVAPVGTVDSPVSFNPEICGTTAVAPTYKHVIVIPEENHSYADIIGSSDAPYVNTLASQCGLATSYHSITHPSLPEYLAATSGLPLAQLTPFLTDCVPAPGCNSTANNVFHQAVRWKSYAESMPTNCGMANTGTYVARHNPAVYYTDLANCATNDVPLGTTSSSALLTDLQNDATAPSVSWVVPDLCDDMHGQKTTCPPATPAIVEAGDSWLKEWIPLITSTPTYQAGDTVIIIIWDEGEGPDDVHGERCAASADSSCHVPAIVIAPSVATGTSSNQPFTHYSLLKTTEDLLGLPELRSATTANSMAAAFGL